MIWTRRSTSATGCSHSRPIPDVSPTSSTSTCRDLATSSSRESSRNSCGCATSCSTMSKRHIDFLSFVLPGWLLPVSALVVAEIAMRATGIQSDGLALPSQIAIALLDLVADGELYLRSVETILPIVIGILLGGTLGLLIGVWLGLSTTAAR